ncbi:MAG: DUF3667 domain-containing protein [Flavobacteriaceae bacterium]|nr:DUF3667 domain-containing protein [Flavobacteriaceae bacterium]
MKLRLRNKSNKLVKIQQPKCFNCGHPFTGHEKFCPECGQKNKDPKITFGNFVHEVFNGFISWDSKFWTTFIPLLINPGKVSRDYIDGKRQRYANPFRFYLTISVLFFLIVGITESYEKFNEFRNGKTKKASINASINNAKKALDSTSTNIQTNFNEALKNLDSTERVEVTKAFSKMNLDSLKKNSKDGPSLQINGLGNWDKFNKFYAKNKEVEIDDALDSLKVEKTFWNRFSYSRIQLMHDIFNDNEKQKELNKQMVSYLSIALFVLLPLFTLFLKFFYIRRKFTYVEHLVFVFHTQTVFFLLLTIFYLLNYFSGQSYAIPIFLLMFIIYLYLAMKKFYKQGHIKTFIKYIFINLSFTFIASIGIIIVALLTFMMY